MLELVAFASQDTCSYKNICQKDAVSNPWRLLSLLPSSWHNFQPIDTRQNCVLQAQPWISTAACGKYPINQIKLISYLHIYNRYTKIGKVEMIFHFPTKVPNLWTEVVSIIQAKMKTLKGSKVFHFSLKAGSNCNTNLGKGFVHKELL